METLLLQREGAVAIVTLNRPEAKNALSPLMADELGALLDALAADDSVAALVLAGAGGAFCAGGDVKAMGEAGPRTPEQRRAAMARYARICERLHALDKPVVAAVDGVAFGAGFSIALFADMVVAGEGARFCMVFQRIGLVPDMGAMYALPRVVGIHKARELVLSAREVDAREALALGIAAEVVPAGAALARATALATALSQASPVAVGAIKRMLRATPEATLTELLDLEADAQAAATGSDYAREATRRFKAKEAPQFRWPPAVNRA